MRIETRAQSGFVGRAVRNDRFWHFGSERSLRPTRLRHGDSVRSLKQRENWPSVQVFNLELKAKVHHASFRDARHRSHGSSLHMASASAG